MNREVGIRTGNPTTRWETIGTWQLLGEGKAVLDAKPWEVNDSPTHSSWLRLVGNNNWTWSREMKGKEEEEGGGKGRGGRGGAQQGREGEGEVEEEEEDQRGWKGEWDWSSVGTNQPLLTSFVPDASLGHFQRHSAITYVYSAGALFSTSSDSCIPKGCDWQGTHGVNRGLRGIWGVPSLKKGSSFLRTAFTAEI